MIRPEDLRSRLRSGAFAVVALAVGLVVHRADLGLNPIARDMLGDALWAMMIFYGLGVLLPRVRRRTRSAIAFALCAAVETSQLYQRPWLNELRATPLGHLVLGSGFDPRDFLAYALGIAAAVGLERAGGCKRSSQR